MKTILIPVDSTPTTENAVQFAAEWGNRYGYGHIILLKTFSESLFDYINISDGYSLVNEESVNNIRENTEELLKRLTGSITKKGFGIKVSIITSNMTILRSINDILKSDPTIELLVLGSDDKSISNDSVVSENIISIARTSRVKTLVVPAGYQYAHINNVLIPCDISRTNQLERLSGYKKFIRQENPILMLLYIDTKDDVAIRDQNKKIWEDYVHRYLSDIQHSIHYSFSGNIVRGILSFASSDSADLIIALPGKHSFLYYMTNKSISEALYQNVDRPVLILK